MKANRFISFLSPAFYLLLLVSCDVQEKKQSPPVSSLTHAQKSMYAAYFKIYKEENFSALVTYTNIDKTDSTVYILYKNEEPSLSFKAYYIKTPVTSVACLASVFFGALNNLQLSDHITAIDNADYICNPTIKKKCAENNIKQLSKTGVLDIEQTLVCKPQVIFINPSGDAKKDFDPRLLMANIIPVICADYFEKNALARAEWVKALAVFFGKEQKADSLFSSIQKNYLNLKNRADTCNNKPTVFTELKTGDVWFVAGGKSNLAQMLQDAGATYVFKDNDKTGALSLNMEQVISKAAGADYWLNLHYANNAADIIKQDKRYDVFKAYKKRNLYNNNALVNETGGNAYWESGLNRPDELLADLIKIFHPGLLPGHTLKYYKHLP
jgi:iron complex transport system substrate-binding protein